MNIFDFTFLFAAGFNFLRREGDTSNDNEGSADLHLYARTASSFFSSFAFPFIFELRERVN